MNYNDINSFYDWLEGNILSKSAILLWFALMHQNNKVRWAEEFTVATSVLCVKTRLDEKSVRNARNELYQKGLLDWESRGGNLSAIYRLISVTGIIEGNFPDRMGDKLPDRMGDKMGDKLPVRMGALNNITKQNKTKRNIKEEVVDDAPVPSELPPPKQTICEKVSCEQIVNLYNSICVSLPRVIQLNDSRRVKIKQRIKEFKSIEKFKELFTKSEQTPFLTGENNRGWKANLDWLMENDKNYLKVFEGFYDNNKSHATQVASNFILSDDDLKGVILDE